MSKFHERLVRVGQELIELGILAKEEKISSISPKSRTSKKRSDLPKGVTKTRSDTYEARIYNPKTKKRVYIKTFSTVEEAAEAVRKEASKLGI